MVKIIIVNIFIFLAMTGFVLIGLPAVYTMRELLGSFSKNSAYEIEINRIASLSNMRSHSVTKEHLIEFSKLSIIYKDFEIWRRTAINSKTINLDTNGFRKNGNTKQGDERVAFFGGSTMWGYGVNDDNTIPSHFSKLSKQSTFNYGEVGYIARQEFNRLANLYSLGFKPKVVVFYDGVNEVLHKCRTEHNFSSSAQESIIANRLNSSYKMLNEENDLFTFKYLAQPTLELLSKIKKRVGGPRNLAMSYDCDTNPEKLKSIARAWYLDWLNSKMLVEANQGKFVAILQPVSYISKPELAHLSSDPMIADKQLSTQYIAVYNEVKQLLSEQNFKYIDLSASLDNGEAYFFDFCHLNPDGNREIAKLILKNI